MSNAPDSHWHRRLLEPNAALFAVLTTVMVSIGGLAEIVPLFSGNLGPEPIAGVTPLTPLEVVGRDLYIREGCSTCHSQMVRPMRSETLRYGTWSRGGEYAYDHPFLLGSRRIGPDLARVGGKWPDAWHWEHLRDPRSTSAGSIMPPYPWLLEWTYSADHAVASMTALQTVGVPYTDQQIADAPAAMAAQASDIVARLATGNVQASPDKEAVALIAYLQRLGKDGKAAAEAGTRAADAGGAP
jgi:cytochrome c oxidase cbb3-type subunit I/II